MSGKIKPVSFRDGKDEELLAWAEAHPNFSAWVREKIRQEIDRGPGAGPSGEGPGPEELRETVERIVQDVLSRRQVAPDPPGGEVKQEVAEDVADLVAAML